MILMISLEDCTTQYKGMIKQMDGLSTYMDGRYMEKYRYMDGGIPTPLKNINQLGWWHSQLDGKIRNVPNHQPVRIL